MSEPLIVRMADVRSAWGRALDATEDRLGPEVSLDTDYYRHLPVQDAFNMASQPKTFTVGQVSDDLHESVREDLDRLVNDG